MLYNVIQVFEVYFKYNWSTYKIIEVFGHLWSTGFAWDGPFPLCWAVPKVIQSIPKSLNTTLVIHWSRERWQKHCAHRASFGKFDVLVQNHQETASLTTANHIRQHLSGGIPHRNGYYGYSCICLFCGEWRWADPLNLSPWEPLRALRVCIKIWWSAAAA